MKNKFLTIVFSLVSITTFAQGEINEIQKKLAGTDKTRWLFEKVQKTMGDRVMTDTGCLYSSIIFSAKDFSFFAVKCGTATGTAKGKWTIKKTGVEEFIITIDKPYEIDFYKKKVTTKDRRFLRLRIQGKTMEEPSTEYHYYAE